MDCQGQPSSHLPLSRGWSHHLLVITLDWKYSSCCRSSLLEDHSQVEPRRLKLLGGENVRKVSSLGLLWHFSRPSTNDIEGRSSSISNFLLATQLWSRALFSHNYLFLLGNELAPLGSHDKAPQTGGHKKQKFILS